jgi:hypothetical protein
MFSELENAWCSKELPHLLGLPRLGEEGALLDAQMNCGDHRAEDRAQRLGRFAGTGAAKDT